MMAAAVFVNARSRQAERSYPPRGHLIDARGVRLHYIDQGSGTAVVLLHGMGSMVEDFALSGVIAQASRRYRVIAFDRPGHGYSERPRRMWTPVAQATLLREALLKLGVERPLIVGHSVGSLVALAYGLAYPRETRGLVLASGYYYPTLRADTPFLVPPAIPVLGEVLRHTISPLVGRLLWGQWLKLLFHPAPVPAYFARFPVWRALAPQQLRAVGEESALLRPVSAAMSRRYASLSVPALIIAGADDRYVHTSRHSLRLHETLPGSAFISVPGAGHMVHHTALQIFMRAITSAA
jgi:pimeloyl-ACP methyl ester carboxylesterase